MQPPASRLARHTREHGRASVLRRYLRTALCLIVALPLLDQNSTAGAQVGWRFEDVVSLGGDSASTTFGSVAGIAFGVPGQLLVLDSQAAEVFIFDLESGRILETVGGKGQGPGEFVEPGLIAATRNGSFYVYDWKSGSRISRFASDGAFLDSTALGILAVSGLITGMAATDDGVVLKMTPFGLQIRGISSGVRHPQLVLRGGPDYGSTRVIWDWTELAREVMSRQEADEGTIEALVEPRPIWSQLASDRFAIATDDRYEVAIVDLRGRVTASLTRDVERRPITAEEKEMALARLPDYLRDRVKLGDFRRVLAGVFPGPDDTILVQRGVDGRVVVDIFAPTGEFITELGVPEGFKPLAGRDGFLAGVETTPSFETAVRVLRIRK